MVTGHGTSLFLCLSLDVLAMYIILYLYRTHLSSVCGQILKLYAQDTFSQSKTGIFVLGIIFRWDRISQESVSPGHLSLWTDFLTTPDKICRTSYRSCMHVQLPLATYSQSICYNNVTSYSQLKFDLTARLASYSYMASQPFSLGCSCMQIYKKCGEAIVLISL